jgi:class 3 adenylate cyclase
MFKNLMIVLGSAFLLLTMLLLHRYLFVRRTKNQLTRKNTIIQEEKDRSEGLLLNILPAETAEELKATGSSQARQFNMVTVLFTDFKDFTLLAEKVSPQELVSEIHYCFKHFDEIISKYPIEKIKTIGDAYMCAGGLPKPNDTNAIDIVKAALDIQRFMIDHRKKRNDEGKPTFDIRIGIHSGPVVAGIVGIKKFQYDIWGDTVNIASRMESSGEVGKVNISQSTYEKVKDKYRCVHRGKIKAKNKGEIDMYFVERLTQ